jgi:hypothetical protein
MEMGLWFPIYSLLTITSLGVRNLFMPLLGSKNASRNNGWNPLPVELILQPRNSLDRAAQRAIL